MSETLVHSESPVEYFRGLVESAIHRQRITVCELTSFYVVNLLAACIQADRAADTEALGVMFVKALQSGGPTQRDALRRVGDTSLLISGFFPDSVARRLVDVDYYVDLGERAYGSLASRSNETFGEVFDELSEKFGAMVEVLNDVSEQSAIGSKNQDLLRLYENWLRTGSRRSGERLTRRGILPVAGNRRVQ